MGFLGGKWQKKNNSNCNGNEISCLALRAPLQPSGERLGPRPGLFRHALQVVAYGTVMIRSNVEESAFYLPPIVNQPCPAAPRVEIAKAFAGLRTRSVSIWDTLKPLARNAGTKSVNTVS